jgi:hypothetical protein
VFVPGEEANRKFNFSFNFATLFISVEYTLQDNVFEMNRAEDIQDDLVRRRTTLKHLHALLDVPCFGWNVSVSSLWYMFRKDFKYGTI